MNQVCDTYFFNYDEAYKKAKEQNMISSYQKQICYYDGDVRTDDLENLCSLPFNNLSQELLLSSNRLPTSINFAGLSLTQNVKQEIVEVFKKLLTNIVKNKDELINIMMSEIKSFKLDFNEPLRFYLIGARQTRVTQYMSKYIANSLKNMKYDVRFDLNSEFEDMDTFKIMKAIHEYNPHVTININNVNNYHLNDDTFNFIWFQDPNHKLKNLNKRDLRKRDFIYSLLPMIDELLIEKEIPFERQSFCVDKETYKLKDDIKREKKIVFIGSDYEYIIKDKSNSYLKAVELVKDKFYTYGELINPAKNPDICDNFNISQEELQDIVRYVNRVVSVLWLCKVKSEYSVEIYGWGWDKYEEIKPYHKGILSAGEEICSVYNSATFTLAPHPDYTLQQRVLESAASGAIPIVYDCRDEVDDSHYDEAVCYYKTFEDLNDILNTKDIIEKEFKKLLEENSFDFFVKNFLKVINKKKGEI